MRVLMRNKIKRLMRDRGLKIKDLLPDYNAELKARGLDQIYAFRLEEILTSKSLSARNIQIVCKVLGVEPEVFGFGKASLAMISVGLDVGQVAALMGKSASNTCYIIRRINQRGADAVTGKTLEAFARATKKAVEYFF